MKTLLVIFFMFLTYAHSEKILAFQISYSGNRPYINLRFIKENYHYDFLLNTYISHSFFSFSDDVPIIKSNIGKEIELNFIESYKGFEYSSSIQIDNSILVNSFNYILSKSDIKYFPDNGLSLAFKPKNEEYSFIHQLYKKGLFDHLQYTFNPNDLGNNKGFIYFGGVPYDEIKKYPFRKDIKIEKGSDSWGFRLKGVKYDNVYHLYDKYTVINSCLIGMIYSDEVMNLLQDILKEKLISNICHYENSRGVAQWISCDEEIDEFEKTIDFTFENIRFTLLIKDLFQTDSYIRNYVSKIKTNNYKHYEKMNILGTEFILMFNLTVFDYEKGMISFYTDNPSIFDISSNENILVKYSIICNILICLFNVLVLMYNQLLNRKPNK